MTNISKNLSVVAARVIMPEHQHILSVSEIKPLKDNQILTIEVEIQNNFPGEWKIKETSPTGVKEVETVRFDFDEKYPLLPPIISLRPDFPRNLPHFYPFLHYSRPVPCIYDGNLVEMIHNEGITGILDRLVEWLDRAANNNLNDPIHGWEPMRRDGIIDTIVADIEFLRNHSYRDKFQTLEFYYNFEILEGVRRVYGFIPNRLIRLKPENSKNLFLESRVTSSLVGNGKSLAFLIWPKGDPNDSSLANYEYLTDMVKTFDDLKQNARKFKCEDQLNLVIEHLKRNVQNYNSGKVTIAILIVIPRPVHLMGSDSILELIPFILEIELPKLNSIDENTLVHSTVLLSSINRNLLVSLSGGNSKKDRLPWTLLGAGSLGSKIAVHFARSGNGPSIVVDKSRIQPHNFARHALLPSNIGNNPFLFKSDLISNSIKQLSQPARSCRLDLLNIDSNKHNSEIFPNNSWAIINTTASNAVRESLLCNGKIRTRIIENTLYAGGKIGLITIEGPIRNPNTGDLISEAYYQFGNDDEIRTTMYDGESFVSRRDTGQGCGTQTMVMSDAKISLFAASMSEILTKLQTDGLSEEFGQIFIGIQAENGMGLSWRKIDLESVRVISTTKGEKWRVHLNARAEKKINEEIANRPNVETGGILMGRISEASRIIYVVDVIDAPEDSTFSPTEFNLGTSGRDDAIRAFSNRVGKSLFCLGTWHSHLIDCPPSKKDHDSLKKLTEIRLVPTVSLIKTPIVYHVLVENVRER